MSKRIVYGPTPFRRRWMTTINHAPADGHAPSDLAGRVFVQVVEVPSICRLNSISWRIGDTSSGNLAVGIYGPLTSVDNAVGAPLLFDSGTIAATGAFGIQSASPANVILRPGQYALAHTADNTTCNFYKESDIAIPSGNCRGYFDQSFGALPSTIPAITMQTFNLPEISIAVTPL